MANPTCTKKVPKSYDQDCSRTRRDNVKLKYNLEMKKEPQHVEDDFSSRVNPFG